MNVVGVPGTIDQLSPPLALLNRPDVEPAYRFAGFDRSNPSASMYGCVNPLFAGVHVWPPSTLLYTPLPAVAAYTCKELPGSIANCPMDPKGRPELNELHVWPASLLL